MNNTVVKVKMGFEKRGVILFITGDWFEGIIILYP
jgi:hypothetical protein